MPTLRELRALLGRRLNAYETVTVGAEEVPGSGTYTGAASGAFAARRIASSDLANLGLSGQDTRSDWWDDGYVLVRTETPEQRRISTNSYNGDATVTDALTGSSAAGTLPVGYVTLDRDLAATAPAGTVVELHGVLPPLVQTDRKPSLRQCINDALGVLRLRRRLTIAGISNAYRYDLSAYGLTREAQLAGVFDSEVVSGQDPYPLPGGGEIRFDGDAAYLLLEATVPTGKSFYVDIYTSRKSWIAPVSTGVFAASTVGLVDDLDACTGDPTVITLVGYYVATAALARPGLDGPNLAWKAEAAEAADLAKPYMLWGQPAMSSTERRSYAGNAYGDSVMFLRRRGGYRGYRRLRR